MSSSTSLAAARNRRSGSQNAPQQPQSRPVTSISSQAAFAQQNSSRNPKMQKQPTTNNIQSETSNGLPFTKLTVSDAIGLITLRLGRVEQFIIDLQEERNGDESSFVGLPENTRVIDNSILTNIINRLDNLEKKDLNPKNNDQIIKFEKELRDAKDLLINVMLKIENYIKDTNSKFSEYDSAILDLEQNIPIQKNDLLGVNLETEESIVSEYVLNDNINSNVKDDDLVNSEES
uniref:Uncharacterized protein n=1 Tax=viral metagenome TaxID=1070528 RepID=A0A6C0ESX2_9ZZZZ